MSRLRIQSIVSHGLSLGASLGAGLGLALSLAACTSPQVGAPCVIRETVTEGGKTRPATAAERESDLKACFSQTAMLHFSAAAQSKLDILFLIDNSPSMSPKQEALGANIPKFIDRIDALKADYHVGVATSDVGSFIAAGMPWSTSLGSCNTFEGDDGTLQRVACNTRTGLGPDAIAACQKLCPDPKFVPEGGSGFIAKDSKGVTNVPGGDVQSAFKCIALVGDNGCGIEGQFEGAKRALDSHNPMNTNFLRPGSVLAVIFITDEDDCSVSLKGRVENDPVTIDCAKADQAAPFNCYNPDYRCLARDVQCAQELNTVGSKTNCRERDTSYLDPVKKYVDFFTGLRDTNKLVVAGIWTPKDGPFNVVQRMGSTKTETLNRGEGNMAACVNDKKTDLFARPQVRLTKFASQINGAVELNVCDTDNYPKALDAIADKISNKVKGNCITGVPKINPANGQAICVVGDVDSNVPYNSPDKAFPACSPKCCAGWGASAEPTTEDPGIKAACMGETTDACYCAVPSTAGKCTDGVVVGVWRKSGVAPADKDVSFKCAVN